MASVRLTKQDKKDFADHMASKLFDDKINTLKEEVQNAGKEVTTLLASPEQISAASLLPDFMVMRRNTFEMRMLVANEGYGRHLHIYIDLPQLTPIPMHEYANRPIIWEVTDSELKVEKWPEWLRPEGKTFCINQLFPKLRAIKSLSQERNKFERDLYNRLGQVTTLNKLKEASKELHDEWIEYYGESVDTPLALRFDDILKTMEKQKAA